MCNICGIVSEKIRPESAYWGKMCEYVAKGKVTMSGGYFVSENGDSFTKDFSGNEYVVVVDGKINNSTALKRSIGLKGAVFETEKISELVLLYYLLLGEGSFKLFKGEFCIVIWNSAEKELLIVRDKVGINTLFYYCDNFRMIFASEINGILKFPCVKKELSDDVYCRLFAFAGGRTLGDTLFQNIYEIPPGCYIRYKNLKTEVVSYHTFELKDSTDNYEYAKNGLEYLSRNSDKNNLLQEKIISKAQIEENIEMAVELSDLPSPYIDLRLLSNIGSNDIYADLTGTFNVTERFKLPSVWCKKQDKEFTDEFLSTLPWFEHKGEKDILKKEEVYIKQYIVLPKVIYAKRKACKNIVFPFLGEDVVEYSLQNLKHSKKISKHFYSGNYKCDKTNYKNLKSLFWGMVSDKNSMAGLIEREELLKFIRLFPRPETMIYLLQVNVWLNRFL